MRAPIQTEADYQAALARLDQVFFAEQGTPDGDEAELLVYKIKEFEQANFPIKESEIQEWPLADSQIG